MKTQLKQLRTAKGLSQDDVAKEMNIKTSRYGTWERGERMLSLEQAWDLADVLGCSLDELAGREFDMKEWTDERQARINHYYKLIDEEQKGAALNMMEGLAMAASQTKESRTKDYKVS